MYNDFLFSSFVHFSYKKHRNNCQSFESETAHHVQHDSWKVHARPILFFFPFSTEKKNILSNNNDIIFQKTHINYIFISWMEREANAFSAIFLSVSLVARVSDL